MSMEEKEQVIHESLQDVGVEYTTFGKRLRHIRKERGMTQLELAQQLGVTDKAVSKWERDLSCPDVATLPKLANILETGLEELMQAESGSRKNQSLKSFVKLVLRSVALAMGIAVAVLSALGQITTESAISMLAIGLAGIALSQIME